MSAIQLEFVFENQNDENTKDSILQKEIEDIQESMSKMRRKLFAEVSFLKKMCKEIAAENAELKRELNMFLDRKSVWEFRTEDYLIQEKTT